MIITLQDDGGVHLYGSVAEAVCDVEPLDAEDVFREVFDDKGRPFVVHWIRPNKFGRPRLGFLQSAENGEYTLVPAGDPQPETLLRTIESASHVDPAVLAPQLREIERRLRGDCLGD